MKKILGIGNALVDELMLIDSESMLHDMQLPVGGMTLIDDAGYEALEDKRNLFAPRRATGGSAGNAMLAVAGLGGACIFVGCVAGDETGRFFADNLHRQGIEDRLVHAVGRSGVASTFITPGGERTFATYLGASALLTAEDIADDAFLGAAIVHVEGYLVQNHALLTRILKVARQCGALVSLDLASYNVVQENWDFLHASVRKGVNILFANEQESEAFTREADLEAALDVMAAQCDIVVQKRGAKGSVAMRGSQRAEAPAHRVQVVDTTGAGDFYAGGFLYALARGGALQQCAEVGALCSAHVIQRVGTALPTEEWNEIKLNVARIML